MSVKEKPSEEKSTGALNFFVSPKNQFWRIWIICNRSISTLQQASIGPVLSEACKEEPCACPRGYSQKHY
jgi:hypothetical protein